MSLPIVVRDATDEDMPYVIGTWRSSYAGRSKLHAFDGDIYFRLLQRYIWDLKRGLGGTLLVAADAGNPDSLLGFAALQGDHLLYVYVRGGKDTSVRHFGVARELLEGRSIKRYAFRTEQGDRRLKPEARGWAYEPCVVEWPDSGLKVEMG